MFKFCIMFASAIVIAATDGTPDSYAFDETLVTPAVYGTRATPPPMTCKRHEIYLPQGQAPNCDTVCSELGDDCPRVYIQAPYGCYCRKGYARDDNNKCIKIKKCPPKTTTTTTMTTTTAMAAPIQNNQCCN